MYKPFNPIVPVELEPIEVAIRRERQRLQDIEFDTGEQPNTSLIEYMVMERARGITTWVINF